MAGNRRTYEETFTGVAVDVDFTPPNGSAIELIDVVTKFNTTPITAENNTIKTIRGGTPITEYFYDPSVVTDELPVRFGRKPLPKGTVIGVDYTNTDDRTVTVLITYEINPFIGG